MANTVSVAELFMKARALVTLTRGGPEPGQPGRQQECASGLKSGFDPVAENLIHS
jgi:hypothetical protein